jgi:hypothetical protein
MVKISRIIMVLLTLTTLLVFPGCKKTDTFSTDGYYQGSFSYQGQILFSAIIFNGSSYSEAPSGGAMNQKFPCITKGTYSIKHTTISFTPTVMPVVPGCTCSVMGTGVKFDCLLDGDFTLVESGDKIIFQKGSGNDLQIYSLTLIKPTPDK